MKNLDGNIDILNARSEKVREIFKISNRITELHLKKNLEFNLVEEKNSLIAEKEKIQHELDSSKDKLINEIDVNREYRITNINNMFKLQKDFGMKWGNIKAIEKLNVPSTTDILISDELSHSSRKSRSNSDNKQ